MLLKEYFEGKDIFRIVFEGEICYKDTTSLFFQIFRHMPSSFLVSLSFSQNEKGSI